MECTPEDLIPSTLKAKFERKLQILYGQQWLNEIQNPSACDSYNIYKTTLNLEPYLTTLEPKHSIPLCKFRANNHRLLIVTGQSNNVDISERHCTLCAMDELGDEYHYLLRCEFFKAAREQYIQSNYTSPANTLKMKLLMNSSNKKELINLSKFIIIIANYFKDKLNNNPV